MGLSISWIGVKGRDQAEVLEVLGLVDTGVSLGERIATYSMCRTPKDWLIIASGLFDFATPARLALLSTGAEAVGVQLEEHVMVSGIRVFRDGQEIWAVNHDPEHGLDNAAVTGAPPDWLQPIIDRLKGQQIADGGDDADVDHVFDVPIDAGVVLCGYRHDEPFEGEDDYPDFKELKPAGSATAQPKTQPRAQPKPPAPTRRPGFLSWLFGRR